MGDTTKAIRYRGFAAGLKRRFNAPTTMGGFWDPSHSWYVHWREPDGSIWGNNLVTPVNLMAIGYGICDDPGRRLSILHAIDRQMQKEDLFFWPICMFSYEEGAGHEQNFPFPNYENGDIFLSWGELAVRAYADDFPEIALRYIKRLIDRYKHDGLAFQRYLRTTQEGAGDDILAGNASAIIGLYRDIYGIQPRYNRLYLHPHLVGELYGTSLRYQFQGSEYRVVLNGAQNDITVGGMTMRCSEDFGLKETNDGVLWFKNSMPAPALRLRTVDDSALRVTILDWSDHRRWTEATHRHGTTTSHEILDLPPGKLYAAYQDGRLLVTERSTTAGHFQFSCSVQPGREQLLEIRPAYVPAGGDENAMMGVSRPRITPGDTLVSSPGAVAVKIDCETAGSVIRYTLDGSAPDGRSQRYVTPFSLTSSATVKARAWREGLAESAVASSEILYVPRDTTGMYRLGAKVVLCHKAFRAPVHLQHPFSPRYPGSGANALTDGMCGTERYATDWQGFEQNDLDATIDLGKREVIDTVRIGFLENSSLWIFYPLSVNVSVSSDGKNFRPMPSVVTTEQVLGNGSSRRDFVALKQHMKCRYVRVHAVNRRTCPPGHPGSGGKAWLFADEIVVE